MGNGECEPVLQDPTAALITPCYSQESTRNYVKEDDQSCKTPLSESSLPSTLQEDLVRLTRDAPAVDDELSPLEKQKPWKIEKEHLEKELYDCTRAHKMSIVQSAYEMSKLQVSFGLAKRQESLAKEQLEDALVIATKLQTKVDWLTGQLRQIENENRRLSTSRSSELDKLTAENESLRKALEAAKKPITRNIVKDVEILTEETAPLIAQHELQTKQLQKIEINMETGEGLVTDQNVLEKWTVENEALHSATRQVLELKQKLAVSERLEADLTTSQLGLEEVTKEKEELLIRLAAVTKELLESKMRIAETEMHDVEMISYTRVIEGLNLEKIALTGQLELLREELEEQKEAARKAQFEANKALEAERDCAKAFKLVEEKEDEMAYYIKQLESLREKNSMLRTQLDMEQQCKEAEIAAMPSAYELSMNQRRRNVDTSMKPTASNGVQNSQKLPLEPTALDDPVATPTASEMPKSSNDDTTHGPPKDICGEGTGKPGTESPDATPNPKPDAEQQPTRMPVKKSLRLRNRSNMQQSTDSGSGKTDASKQVFDLTEKDSDEIDGVIEDETQRKKRSTSRLKRPPVAVPHENETSKKKGRKKYLNARKAAANEADAELGPAHLLVRRSDRDERTRNVLNAYGPTPSRRSVTPRSGSRLPR